MPLVNETLVTETIELADALGTVDVAPVRILETIEVDDRYDEDPGTSAVETIEVDDRTSMIISPPRVLDTLELTDTVSDSVRTSVVDTIECDDFSTTAGTFNDAVRDTVTLRDFYSQLQREVVIESIECDDSVVDSVFDHVTETLELDDSLVDHRTVYTTVLETIELADSAASKIVEDPLVDTATVLDAADDRSPLTDTVIETVAVVAFSTQAVDGTNDSDTVRETLTVVDSVSYVSGSYADRVFETLTVEDWIYSRDFGSMAWVMNTETGAPSYYDNYEFASLVEHDGVLLAAGREGLYVVQQDNDSGREIPGTIQTGFLDWQTSRRKRLRDIYVGYTGAQLELKVEAYNEPYGEHTYEMVEREADAPRNNRIRVGRGLNSRYWRFTLTNPQGGAFQVFDAAANVDVSNRRL
jgi:hypothetical protein